MCDRQQTCIASTHRDVACIAGSNNGRVISRVVTPSRSGQGQYHRELCAKA